MSQLKHLAFAGALLAGTALATPAHAILQIAADVNGSLFSCQDGAACDTDGTVNGSLTIGTQTLGGGVTFNGSNQQQTIGPPTNALVTGSQTITNSTGAVATISFAVSGTDFGFPTSIYNASGSITYLNAIGSTVDLQWYGDTANNQGASTVGDLPGTLLEDHAFLSTTIADSFSTGNLNGPFATSAPFSWTMAAVGTLAAGATATISNRGQVITNDVVPVPEPTSLVIFGSALIGLGILARRKQRKDERNSHLATA